VGVGTSGAQATGDAATTGVQGAALASYLLFEAPFTRELIALGETDTLARQDEVLRFFGWDTAPARTLRGGPDIVLP
jgi:NTE family protein